MLIRCNRIEIAFVVSLISNHEVEVGNFAVIGSVEPIEADEESEVLRDAVHCWKQLSKLVASMFEVDGNLAYLL